MERTGGLELDEKRTPQEAPFPASRLEQGARELEGAERSRRGVSDQSQIAHHGLPGGLKLRLQVFTSLAAVLCKVGPISTAQEPLASPSARPAPPTSGQ